MPYRAMITTVVSVVIALVAVAMWVRAVEPMVAVAAKAPGWELPLTMPANWPAGRDYYPPPERELRVLVKGTATLSLLLICLLLLVGFAFSSVREYVRRRTSAKPERANQRTKYVDAWKLAGERLKSKEAEDDAAGEE